MSRPLKILFVSPEVFPFARTGGLADVSRSLPKALVSLGHDVRCIMPFYGCVSESGFKADRLLENIRHPLSGRIFGFDLFRNVSGGITTYFVHNRKYFSRDGLYGTAGANYPDNALRFGFFSKAALAAVKAVRFRPDIIHCNDWQSALIPLYLRSRLVKDVYYSGIKTLFTIHNLAYQGVFGKRSIRGLGVPPGFFNINGLEFHGKVNFMKAGIIYSDAISTVSRRYAMEVMTPEYGCGLQGLLKTREHVLFGILNGVDYDVWSPEKDRFIKPNYGAGSIENKMICKKRLMQFLRLSVSMDRPLIGCVARLVYQKGMDILVDAMDGLMRMNVGFVILGRGDTRYERAFTRLAEKYPANISMRKEFNDELAHRIEAGCDMFLMPSRYEPCGLNQMYSIRYGTIPIVRATGGLDDVIKDFDRNREQGNGFKFGPMGKDALLYTVKRAISCFEDKDLWKKLMLQAMSCDFSWKRSAGEYAGLYEKLSKRGQPFPDP